MRLISLCLAALLLTTASARADGMDGLERLIAAWLDSPHGNYHSRSFTYWNTDGAVPESCAMCHSETGFLDYLGVGGHTPGQVDHPGTINTVIGCASCHTAEAHALDAVSFPSGVEVAGLGESATCMVCHQGRQSADQVAARVAGKAEDEVSEELAFINIHYAASAATMMGSVARPGYQYAGRDYVGRFAHVPGADTCVACHEPHSTTVATDGCIACHRGAEDLRDIRTQHRDFAGTDDRSGGIHSEIVALKAQLLDAIRLYAADVAGTPIAYAASHPYFFTDPTGTGVLSEDQITRDNRYQSWTPRLLKAAYNYQVASKDPGGYVHNPTYMVQILHDSLADLAEATGADVTHLTRP